MVNYKNDDVSLYYAYFFERRRCKIAFLGKSDYFGNLHVSTVSPYPNFLSSNHKINVQKQLAEIVTYLNSKLENPLTLLLVLVTRLVSGLFLFTLNKLTLLHAHVPTAPIWKEPTILSDNACAPDDLDLQNHC